MIDNSFKIYATQVGQTTCTITAQINQQTVSKNIVIIVEPKQVEFSCNKNAFFAGKKADDSYETYRLTINANYNFDSVDCSDNVVIYKHEKLSNNQAILFFYLTQEGFFEIVLDNFCFKKSATAFVLPPKLLVDGQPFEQKSLTLYLLEHNIEQANLQGYFASANISTSQNCFDFVVQNPQVATIQNGNLQAVGVGTTIVDIVAIDGSGFCAQIEVVVEQIKATSCSFIKSITVESGEQFEIEICNFEPCFATVFQVDFECENVQFENGLFTAYQNGTIFVFLNGTLIGQIEVIVEVLQVPQLPQNEYELMVVGNSKNNS